MRANERRAHRLAVAPLAGMLIGAALAGAGCSEGDGVGSGSRGPDQHAAGTSSGGNAGSGEAGTFANAQEDPSEPGEGSSGTGNTGTAGTQALMPPGGQPPGTFKPPSELDRDAGFEWPETEPGAGSCEPGTYTGTFMCEWLATPESGLPLPPDGTALLVTGPVSLRFERSMDGEFLELADAKLEGVAMDFGLGFNAGLVGRLDCATRQLSAEAVDGVYGLGLPVAFPFDNFSGSLEGALDGQTLVLTGTWALSPASIMDGNCRGPWTASLAP